MEKNSIWKWKNSIFRVRTGLYRRPKKPLKGNCWEKCRRIVFFDEESFALQANICFFIDMALVPILIACALHVVNGKWVLREMKTDQNMFSTCCFLPVNVLLLLNPVPPHWDFAWGDGSDVRQTSLVQALQFIHKISLLLFLPANRPAHFSV